MDQTCTLEGFLTRVQQRDPHQTEFAQAVREVMTTLWPFLEENPRYRQLALLERLVEPERVIQFRVVWFVYFHLVDDVGSHLQAVFQFAECGQENLFDDRKKPCWRSKSRI